MKSILMTIAIFFSGLSYIDAQSFHFGVKVGSNIDKITGQSFKNEFTYGYHAGFFAQVGLGTKWTIQPEVVFNQLSTDTAQKFSELYNVSTAKISNIKLSYLSIPVLLNYNIGSNLALQVGPQYGMLLQQNKDLLQNGKDAFTRGDFSMVGGVQIKLSSLRIYGRYAIGLNNLNDIDSQDKWKTQSIQLGLGLTLF